MKKSLLYTPLLLSLIAFLWVAKPLYLAQEQVFTVPEYSPPTSPKAKYFPLQFTDESLKWGLIAQHRQSSKFISSFVESLGAGICILDINNDGWMDVFVVGGSGFTREYGKAAWWHKSYGNRLFLNKQGKYLKDISESFKFNKMHTSMGCAAGDLNGDNYTDLIVSGLDGHFLYANNGKGIFSPIENSELTESNMWATQAAFADVNNDGLVDFYGSHFVKYHKGEKTFEQNQGFTNAHDVGFSPRLYDPQMNHLYINQGDFKFVKAKNNNLIKSNTGRSLGARWQDFNQDGALDLLVLNEFDSVNRLFLGDNSGGFSEAKTLHRSLQISGSRDVVIGELTDGSEQAFFFTQGAGKRNTLLGQNKSEQKHSDNKQRYTELSDAAKVSKKEFLYASSWGAVGADLNNDGSTDIYLANGRGLPDPDASHVTQRQNNLVYTNTHDGKFIVQSGEDPKVSGMSSRGVVTADLNNDGQLEILISNNNDAVQLMEISNEYQHHWIGLSLSEKKDWQGGKIIVSGANRKFVHHISYKQNLFSQSDPRIHFGLGDWASAVDIMLISRQGEELLFTNVIPDHYYYINFENSNIQPIDYSQKKPLLKPYFTIATDEELINWARLLLNTEPVNKNDVINLWQVANSSVKKEILSLVKSSTSPLALYLQFDALRSNNSSLIKQAIDILAVQELEFSISWLTPLLSHNDHSVVCRVASTLRFFFDEEEAVVYRKQLSVAPMLRQLPQASPQSQSCILDAIAAAENKRAISGLIVLLANTTHHEVLTKTIRALGLLRDSEAISTILKVLEKHPKPDILTSGFIALSRLDYPQLEALMNTYFIQELAHTIKIESENKNSNQESKLLSRMATLHQIYTHEEATVIPKAWLLKITKNLEDYVNKTSSPSVLQQYLTVLASSRDSRFYLTSKVYLNHGDAETEQAAVTATLTLANAKQGEALESKILGMSHDRQKTILRTLNQKHHFSLSFIKHLVKRYQVKHSIAVLDIATLMNSRDLENFLSLLMKKLTPDQQTVIMKYLLEKEISLHKIPEYLLLKRGLNFDATFLQWYYRFVTPVSEQNHVLKIRLKLNSVLFDPELAIKDKTSLIKLAAKRDEYVANQYFDIYKDHVSIDEMLEIIELVSYKTRSNKLKKLVLNWLETKKMLSKVQILRASVILPVSTTEDVLHYLQNLKVQ